MKHILKSNINFQNNFNIFSKVTSISLKSTSIFTVENNKNIVKVQKKGIFKPLNLDISKKYKDLT